ncbi:GS homeobox 2 isoform X1 [Arvicanthis niloticus]|uniref:GS homeobox 2 isoform X1 n=1 Tax=Arvicanthis niloticus TaxID=61156 RepID=UPI00402B8677
MAWKSPPGAAYHSEALDRGPSKGGSSKDRQSSDHRRRGGGRSGPQDKPFIPCRHVALFLCGLTHHQGLLAARTLAAGIAPRAGFLHPAGHAVPVGDVSVRARLSLPQKRRFLRVPALRHLAPAFLSPTRRSRWRSYGDRRACGGGRRDGWRHWRLTFAQEPVLSGSWGRAVLPTGEPRTPSPPPASAPPSPSPAPAAQLGCSGGRCRCGGCGGGSSPGTPAAPRTCLRRHYVQRVRPTEIPLPHHGRLRYQPGTQWQKDEDSIYQHSAPGARARILFQYVPVPTPENRDRDLPEPVREAGENLVSEPSREAQEGGERRFKEQPRKLQVRG